MRRLPLALLSAALVLAASAAHAAAEPLDAKTRAAVDRGLSWLSVRWAPNAPEPKVSAREKPDAVAIPAITGLAFLAAGAADVPDSPYAGPMAECLKVVLAHQQKDGLFASDRSHGPMYGHAFATLFVAHVYAKNKDAALKDPIERAVRLIERCQNAEGGWRYRAERLDADVTVTAAQLVALRAADRAGVKVDAGVIDRGAAYVATLQSPDGGFRYMADTSPRNVSGTARTAAATFALHAWGKAAAADRARALQYLANVLQAVAEGFAGPDATEGHVYDRHDSRAQVLWESGGAHRDKHLPVARNTLLGLQREDGSWDGDFTVEYATAMALIALQVPEQRLSLADAPDRHDGAPSR